MPLLKAMAKVAFEEELPILLSTGMSTLSEIKEAMDVFLSLGSKRKR